MSDGRRASTRAHRHTKLDNYTVSSRSLSVRSPQQQQLLLLFKLFSGGLAREFCLLGVALRGEVTPGRSGKMQPRENDTLEGVGLKL